MSIPVDEFDNRVDTLLAALKVSAALVRELDDYLPIEFMKGPMRPAHVHQTLGLAVARGPVQGITYRMRGQQAIVELLVIVELLTKNIPDEEQLERIGSYFVVNAVQALVELKQHEDWTVLTIPTVIPSGRTPSEQLVINETIGCIIRFDVDIQAVT